MQKRESNPTVVSEEEIPTVREQPSGQNMNETIAFPEQFESPLVPKSFCDDEKSFWLQQEKSIKEEAEKELEQVRNWAVASRSSEEMKIQRLKMLEKERSRKLEFPLQALNSLGTIEAELRKGVTENAKNYVDRILEITQKELKMAIDSFEQYQKTEEGKYYSNLRRQQLIDQAQFRNINNQRTGELLEKRIAITNELLEEMKNGKSQESRVNQFRGRLKSLQNSKNQIEHGKVLTDKNIAKIEKTSSR